MRKHCYFKETKDNKSFCTYPKILKVCFLCNKYLKSDDNLDKKIQYINFVNQRIHNTKILFISIIAMIISFLSIIIALVGSTN